MAPAEQTLDRVLEKLVRDVETAVHALYRGDARQQTVKARTDVHRKAARDALASLVSGAGRAAIAPAGAAGGPGAVLARGEAEAIIRCIMAWLSMGAPATADPGSRCVPAGRELLPSWGERELARQALRRLTTP